MEQNKHVARSFFLAAKKQTKTLVFCFCCSRCCCCCVNPTQQKISTQSLSTPFNLFVYVPFQSTTLLLCVFLLQTGSILSTQSLCSSSTPIRLVLSVCNPLRKLDRALSFLRVSYSIFLCFLWKNRKKTSFLAQEEKQIFVLLLFLRFWPWFSGCFMMCFLQNLFVFRCI